MSALQDILAPAPETTLPTAAPAPAPMENAPMPPSSSSQVQQDGAGAVADAECEKTNGAESAGQISGEPTNYTSTTTSTRRNASGSVSSVYSGNKIRHLKKEDGIPLWRKDIQYDFLKLVFDDDTKCFSKYSEGAGLEAKYTFAEIYIDTMAKSSKCSKILKEKLLQDIEGAIYMAMVCLLVNVGRMNTTLNFFPEMRAQLRTYHSIPALQAHQDPSAYKQLQDAPRLKSILKGATEDEPQPSTMEEIRAASVPRTNPVNLIFVMSQYAPKISELHFVQPRDFFDLVMRGSLSSLSRARAFLWLIWWYLESDFSFQDTQRNPFGQGQHAEGEKGTGALPLKVPSLESLTEEQAALENVDTEEEELFGEVKRKERIAILASEPSPAMTALKRARKEKGLTSGGGHLHSDDDVSEVGGSHHSRAVATSVGRLDGASEYTRSPSPPVARSSGFQAVNAAPKSILAPIATPAQDMRINTLLNDDNIPPEPPSTTTVPPTVAPAPIKKGPGRGNWRRSKPRADGSAPASGNGPGETQSSHHVTLLPNTGQHSFINDTPQQHIAPATPGSGPYSQALPYMNSFGNQASPNQTSGLSFIPASREHIPTPSYQAQKRHRGITQHQSAVLHHRKQQIEYTLDRRIRKMHHRARDRRESEGAILRAWKRMKLMRSDYDSEEEAIKMRKARDRADKEYWRTRDNAEDNLDADSWRRPRVLLAGYVRTEQEAMDVGEEARLLAKTFRRANRRLERWQEAALPGQAMIRRRQLELQGQGFGSRRPRTSRKRYSIDEDGIEMMQDGTPRGSAQRHWSGTGRSGTGRPGAQRAYSSERRVEKGKDGKMRVEPDDEDGAGELDEEDRELLGEVDADESEDEEEGADEEMCED